jgi:hypothetical protein
MPEIISDPPPDQTDEQDEIPTCETCGETEDECTCRECNWRNCTHRGEVCSDCECCPPHCGCWTCDGCGGRFSENESSCNDCNECSNCCSCNDEDDEDDDEDDEDESSAPVAFADRGTKFHDSTKLQHKRNPSSRYIASEIEVSKAQYSSANDIDAACRKWKASIVRDGSLPASGFEICTSPASGDQWCNQIEEICDALSAQDAEVSASCGLHVHLDARDFTYWEVRKLILLYAKIENALFAMVPSSRRSSSYCERCAEQYVGALRKGKIADTRKSIARGVYLGSLDERGRKEDRGTKYLKKNKYADARYRALNLHSWFYRGTVECRLHTGTVNADKIVPWGILWSGILDSAYRMTEAQIDDLHGHPVEILESLAPTAESRNYVTSRITKHS